MGIQIKKLEESLNIIDHKLTETMKATDAIRFDYEQLKKQIEQ